MGLCGSHLGHQVVGVDREVLLRLRLSLEQVGVKRIAEWGGVDRLRLVQIVACKEVVEVGRARIVDIEGVGREVVALRSKVRSVVLRQGWVGLEEGLVGQHLLLREWLGLYGGQVLRGVELRVADGTEAGGVVQ